MPTSPAIRRLAWNELLRTFGRGAVASLLPLYLYKFGGLSLSDVAFATGLGGALGILLALPAGRIIDQVGSKRVAITSKIIQGAALAAMSIVSGFAPAVAAFAIMLSFDTIAAASGGALIAHAVPREDRVQARAYLRTIHNVGVTLGVAAGGLALATGTRQVYVVVLVLAGLISAGSAVTLLGLPTSEAATSSGRRSKATAALRDGTYAWFTFLYLVLSFSQNVLTLGLPLYIAANTHVPTWTYSVLLVINTALVIVLQIRFSRSSGNASGARSAVIRSGRIYGLAMLLLVTAAGKSIAVALASLVAFVVVLSIGEILQSAGGWGLSYHLAPEDGHGAYQALFALVSPLSNVAGPLLIGSVLVRYPTVGALAFAATFVLASGLLARSRGLIERTRTIGEGVSV